MVVQPGVGRVKGNWLRGWCIKTFGDSHDHNYRDRCRKIIFRADEGGNRKHEIYHISHKDGAAVLMSEEQFESLQVTLSLLSAKGFRDDFGQAGAPCVWLPGKCFF